ncbi:MSEP-CTERM sorting domain-containing protein [Hymenobacter sp. B1770]|uniref:MSEP-CTERM sorting domain-containing protein n=1 Tax=Hymenobacter sp. B1770 TaxID=1718788 RepID=UPI003CF8026B
MRNPKWLLLVNTAPVLLFMAICYGEFSIVHTLLPAESLVLWQRFGMVLGLLVLVGAGYAAVRLVQRQPLSALYSIGALLAYSLLLCLFTSNGNEVLPRSVPRWMVPTDLLLMAWTFLMPTLAHAMLGLVAKFTPDDQPQHVGANVAFAVLTPLVWLVVFQVMGWLVPASWPAFATVLFVGAWVLCTLSFFFFLVRSVYIIAQRQTGFWAESQLVWKVVITLVLPLAGLALNNGVFWGSGIGEQSGIFGNFTSPWFYLLAILNSFLLCVPSPERPVPRLLLLAGRSALFGYTFYFFLVFLPFLPLSIPAIVLLGTGFLLLAPLLLFIVHVRQLSVDVAVLRQLYSKAVVVGTLVVGLAVLPLYFTASYWQSRQALHTALAYVYTPDYAAANHVNAPALARTLEVIRTNKTRDWDFLTGSQLPYLSAYFNWIVLDNLMLSDNKINDLEQVFYGPKDQMMNALPVGLRPMDRSNQAAPELRSVSSSSTYDARQQAWVSWVNLEIANTDTTTRNGEYSTSIALPTGCWVSDYYLTIGNRQERGILAEKKAALWVFTQIVNENQSRDPGLVNYLGPNKVAVRVYPVMGREPRRTRIQLLHKEPCTLTIDGRAVTLGNAHTAPLVAAPVATPDQGVVYLSALAKQRLPLVQRRPYYHFLIDGSIGQRWPLATYEARIAQQLIQSLPHAAPPRFSIVNAYTTPLAADADWRQELKRHAPTGGFFLTGAFRRTLFEAHQRPTPTYPVLVVVTDNLQNAVLDEDFEDFSSAYPESEVFYVLGADGQAVPHSLRRTSRQPVAATGVGVRATAPAVRAWPNATQPQTYLPDNGQANIVLGAAQAVPSPGAIANNRWLAGLLLRGYSQWQSFHPETTDRERVPFIQASFRAGIMTPFTSFLALENDAQKAALYRKQAQVLAANASLDTMEENPVPPIETPIDSGVCLLLVAGGLLAGWHFRRAAQPTA